MTAHTAVNTTPHNPKTRQIWRYDPHAHALYMPHPLNPATDYWVPIPRDLNDQRRGEWVQHIATKTWATPAILRALDTALSAFAAEAEAAA